MAASAVVMLIGRQLDIIRQKRDLDSSIYSNITTSALDPVSSQNTMSGLNVTTISNTPPRMAARGLGFSHLSHIDGVVLSLHAIIFLLALIGNGLVITTLIQNRRMRTITNIFLLNLAISDLLLAIVCMPFTVIPFVLQHFMFGATMCILIRYLQGVTVSASAFTLVAISLERFYAICSPLKSRKWQNMRHSYKVIGGIWVAAIILNIPMAAFQSLESNGQGSKQCTDSKWPDENLRKAYYVFHLLIADLLVPLTIMSIAYGMIAKTLWNGFKTMSVIDTAETPTANGLNTKRQMSLTSEASDISDESEMPLTGGVMTPTTPSCTSPTGEPHTKFNFALTTQHSRQIRQSVSRQETMNSMRSHSSRQLIRSKRRVIKMLFVIVIEFFVCWSPLYLVYLWIMLDTNSARKHISSPTVTLSMLRLLAYISSCCNPITYCFMSKKFRVAFLTAFRCRRELKRQATYQSTQVSYCENNHQHLRGKLSIPSANGHNNKPTLPILPEVTSLSQHSEVKGI